MRRRALGMLSLAVVLGSCAPREPAPAGTFDLPAFFDGAAASRGTVTTAFVRSEDFTAGFEGRRDGNVLMLDERFRFPEGRRLQRWHLRRLAGGRYEGTVETEGASGALHAPVPVEGRTEGSSVELAYDGYAPGGDAVLHFRHRMTPRPDGAVENRVRVSKFGLPLAGASVVFERVPNAAK